MLGGKGHNENRPNQGIVWMVVDFGRNHRGEWGFWLGLADQCMGAHNTMGKIMWRMMWWALIVDEVEGK